MLTFLYRWYRTISHQNYDLASHTTYFVCVNVIHYIFKVDSERQISKYRLHGNIIYIQSFLPEIC